VEDEAKQDLKIMEIHHWKKQAKSIVLWKQNLDPNTNDRTYAT
jgi:hypothetical protein